ncbi:ABC transporter substrate-binding protein [Shouchella sp. 1P09AA]|uniref:ABC transporter substrate-binding protein n=1 Tax=unclassified Shouchella TaxID=2893065 RepID=UPI0039A16B3D
MKKKPFYTFLATAVFATALVACNGGDSETGTDGEEGEGGEAVEGGSITLGMTSTPENQFNPIIYSSTYDNNIITFVNEGLTTQNSELEFEPGLASEWEFSDDMLELTYHLEEGVTWHDGEPFTADDVVFTFTSIADPGYTSTGATRHSYASSLVGYEEYSSGESDTFEGVEAIDEHTVRFYFKEPNVKALADTAIGIFPQHKFEGVAVEDFPNHAASTDAGEVIGTGPFKLQSVLENESYELVANEDYWKGAPELDAITWRVVDASVSAGMLEQGELDFMPNYFPAADYDQVDAVETLTINEQPALGYQHMSLKMNHGPNDDLINPDAWTPNEKFEDVRFREAIFSAVDRQLFIDSFLRGHGEMLDAPFAEASWVYDPEGVEGFTYDPEHSKALLEEAGYEDTDGDGFVEDPDGNELVLNIDYPLGNPVRERVAPVVAEQLAEVGINTNVRNPMEAGVYFDNIQNNEDEDLDIYLAGWSLASGDPDPGDLYRSTAMFNYSRFQSDEQDQLLLEAVDPDQAFDNQEFRQEKYMEWAQLFIDNSYVLPLYAESEISVYNSRLQGVEFLPHTYTNDTHLWYVTE